MNHTPEKALHDWIKGSNINQSELARRIGVHRSSITLYLQGRRRPSKPTACLIEHITAGYVPAKVWQVSA